MYQDRVSYVTCEAYFKENCSSNRFEAWHLTDEYFDKVIISQDVWIYYEY